MIHDPELLLVGVEIDARDIDQHVQPQLGIFSNGRCEVFDVLGFHSDVGIPRASALGQFPLLQSRGILGLLDHGGLMRFLEAGSLDRLKARRDT